MSVVNKLNLKMFGVLIYIIEFGFESQSQVCYHLFKMNATRDVTLPNH